MARSRLHRNGALAATAAVLMLAAVSSAAASEEHQTWTVMVYMAADVDSPLPWLQDLNEMEAAPGSEMTDVVVLVDPPETGDTLMLHIETDPDFFDPELVSTELEGDDVIPGGGEVNTGSAATLRDFVVFCATHYPADRLILVLWGHGAGWRGLCPDGTDILTLPELDAALDMAEEDLGRGLDMIVLDVCDGATVELAYEVSEYADMLVASEETVPAEGLPYRDVLKALNEDPSQTVEEFGCAIVDIYTEWAVYGAAERTSMSAIDLGALASAVDGLDSVSAFGARFDRLFHEELCEAFGSSFGYDSWNPDVGSALLQLSGADLPLELRVAAIDTVEAYTAAVIHHAAFDPGNSSEAPAQGTTGMTAYVHSSASSDASYLDLDIAATSWDELGLCLRSEGEDADGGPGPEVVVDDDTDDGIPDYVMVTWSPDDEWNYTGYTVYAYSSSPHGLTLVDEVHAVTPVVRIDGLLGYAALSTAAMVGGEAYSYELLDQTVEAMVPVNIVLEGPGTANGGTLQVVLTSERGEAKVLPCTDGTCTAYLAVPAWAQPGEMVTVEVRDGDSEAPLAERTIRMASTTDLIVTIEVPSYDSDAADLTIPLSVVATLAMLAVAVIVYWNTLRRR